jgi:hypothetical protein
VRRDVLTAAESLMDLADDEQVWIEVPA